MKLGVLFSGGKDSVYAMYKVKEDVSCLISLISRNPESYMFHTPNISMVDLQAKAIWLPIIKKATKGKKETELRDLKSAIKEAKKRFGIQGIVTGGVESVYQAERFQKICNSLDVWCFNPLWQKDQEQLLKEVIENKFKIIISGVFAYPFMGKEWLGKVLDKKSLQKLLELRKKYSISPTGEGGEIETTVLDAPFFKKRIDILDYEIRENGSGLFIIKKARLVKK